MFVKKRSVYVEDHFIGFADKVDSIGVSGSDIVVVSFKGNAAIMMTVQRDYECDGGHAYVGDVFELQGSACRLNTCTVYVVDNSSKKKD